VQEDICRPDWCSKSPGNKLSGCHFELVIEKPAATNAGREKRTQAALRVKLGPASMVEKTTNPAISLLMLFKIECPQEVRRQPPRSLIELVTATHL